MASTRKNPDPILIALEAAYRRFGVAGRSVLLAVSGGADSTALLLAHVRLPARQRPRAEVASLDHGLRSESAGEVDQVRALAAKLGLPFHTRALGLAAGPGVEERARRARYQALEAIRAEAGLDFIATAHTASDQAETLLMRLSRGASLRGAAAIWPCRGRLVRPLLEVERAAIERSLSLRGAAFITDPMNFDRAHLRSRFRHEVLPALVAAAGPEVARRLARFAAMALEDDDLLTSYAADALSRVRLDAGGLDAVGVRALLPPLRRRVLAQFLEAAGVGVDHELIERCTAAVERGGAATLGKARCLKCAGGTVRIAGPPPEHANRPGGPALELALDAGGVADGPSGVTVSLTSEPALGELTLAVAPGPLPFALRHRLPGDRVGRRKLQDVLVDLRVPEEHRDRVPLVCDADGKIVWVVGLWPARRGLPAGGRALYLTAQVSAASRAREWLLRYRLARNFRSNHSRKGF